MKIRLWILLLCAVAGAKNGVDVVYLGLVEGGAPALEKQFDLTMRENLSTLPQVSLIDYRKTIEFVKHIGFNGSPELSRSLIEYLQKFCSDSTVIIWGRVERYNIQTARRFLIRSFASGELIIAFKVYSLSFKDYAFSGDIGFKTTIPKGLIGFGDVKEQVHVSAQDIVDISQNLCSNVSRQTVHSIQSIIRSEIMRISDRQENVGTLDKTQEPAIGDVFDMPSMDAPSVAPQSIDTAAVKQ